MVPEENRQRPLDILIQACEKPPSSRRFWSSPRETHDALTAGELLAWNNPVQVGSVFVVLCGAPVRLLSWFSSLMFHENVWMCVCVWYIYIYIYITRAHVCEACFLQTKRPFFWTAWLCFCCGSLRSNAHSLSQAPMVAMNVRRMLDVMAGCLNRRMFGYVFCCRVQPFIERSSASDNKDRFKPIRSHVHAGPGLTCSVASMSYPSIATDQIIRNYVMIGFQSGS